MSDHIADAKKKVGHTPKATLHEFQVALLRQLLKSFPAGDIEDIVSAINAYEPNKKEISRLFELSNKRGEQVKALLEAAKECREVLAHTETMTRKECALCTVLKAIAEAEGKE